MQFMMVSEEARDLGAVKRGLHTYLDEVIGDIASLLKQEDAFKKHLPIDLSFEEETVSIAGKINADL